MKEKENKTRQDFAENLRSLGVGISGGAPKELFKKNRLFFYVNTIFESFEKDFRKTRVTQATHVMDYLLEYLLTKHESRDSLSAFANNLVYSFNHWESSDDEIKFLKTWFFDQNANFKEVEFYNRWRRLILRRYGRPSVVAHEQPLSTIRVPKEQWLDFSKETLEDDNEVVNKLNVMAPHLSKTCNGLVSAFEMMKKVMNQVQKIRASSLDKSERLFFISKEKENQLGDAEAYKSASNDKNVYLKNGFQFQIGPDKGSPSKEENRSRVEPSPVSFPTKSSLISLNQSPKKEKKEEEDISRENTSIFNSGIQTPQPNLANSRLLSGTQTPQLPGAGQRAHLILSLGRTTKKITSKARKNSKKEKMAILQEMQDNFLKFGDLSDWLDHNYAMEPSEIKEIKTIQKERNKYYPEEKNYKPHVFADKLSAREFTKKEKKEEEIDIQANLRKLGWVDPQDPSDFKDQHPHEIAADIKVLRRKLADAKKEEEFMEKMVKGLVNVTDFYMKEYEEDVAMITVCEEVVKRVKDDVKGREEYDSLLKKMDEQFYFDCRKSGRVEPDIYEFIKTKLMSLPKEVKIVDFMSAKKKLFQHFIDASNPFLMMLDELEKNEEPIAIRKKRNYSLFDNLSFVQQTDEPIDIEKYRKAKAEKPKKETKPEEKTNSQPMDEIDMLLNKKMGTSLNKRMSLLNPNFASKTESVIISEDPLQRLLRLDLLGSVSSRQRSPLKKPEPSSMSQSPKKPVIPPKAAVIAEEEGMESDSEIHTDSEDDEYD